MNPLLEKVLDGTVISTWRTIGYRHGEAGFSASTVTQEMTFSSWPDLPEPIVRQVEMTVPSRTFSRSGFIYGLRLHFRL